MSVYLAIDLGTTGCRSILFDNKLDILASDYEEYALLTEKENYVEQDAMKWWELTLSTSANAIEKAGISGEEIDSISISSQGITIVPVDENFTPLYNAITWLDTRAESETDQMKEDFSEEKIFTLTGKPVSSAYTLPKLMWLKSNQPQVFDKAYKFLMPMDFLIARFTGECVTDYSMASGTLMYDINNSCWSKEILDFYGIREDKLPKIISAGKKAGFVLPEVAKRLGLKKDCVIAVGAQDQKCAAYGVGLKDGIMTISLGTAAAITKLWKTANTQQNDGVGWCGYIDKDEFVTEGVINTAGTCLRWIRDMLFKGEKYNVIDKEAKEALERGSSLLFYPYLAGASSPDYYPDSNGVFYGMSLATARGDFALAVMEGIAFQIRVILEAMKAYGNVDTLVLFGGGANGTLWPSIIANATGMKIYVPKSFEAAGAGAAMLAAKATGVALEPMETENVFLPENADKYNEKYLKYREIEKKLWA
ncbi:MAG: hypothetical protein IJD45_01210 [Clostridia bacterium]|nr:hypothetical protein [Clostridia bacterium]